MYLDFLHQISKLLTSSEDLSRTLNTVLIMLEEYQGLRNPMLLVKDSVTNKYFIELAPELNEEEKTHWNKRLAESCPFSRHKLFYEMVMPPEELKHYQLPYFSNVRTGNVSVFIHPLYGKDRSLPLGYLYAWLPSDRENNTKLKVLRVVSDMLAMCLTTHGMKTDVIYQQSSEAIPMPLDGIVAISGEMRQLAELTKKIAPSRATILIRGESGTGKELIARSIHKHSLRHNAPFVSINCAALSDNLLESELFGHEQGAFTGAVKARVGRFEMAHGGTLFLDEIGDTSLEFQTKLLRVLQEGEFERLGSSKTLSVDVRIVCATNVDLESSIQQNLFREDLFYRLNVVTLKVPPLRDRHKDIPVLVKFFLKELNEEYQKQVQVSTATLDAFRARPWPGNIRELQNAVHSAFLMENNGMLDLNVHAQSTDHLETSSFMETSLMETSTASPQPSSSVEQEEIHAIQKALNNHSGVQLRAAEHLGITLRQLRYRIKKYKIPVRKIRV